MTAPEAPAFRAVADPTRRAILDLLLQGARPVNEIAASFPVSRPAISKHLRLLRQAELVAEHRVGRKRIYELAPGPLRSVDEWLEHYRKFWEKRLWRLKRYLESEAGRKGKDEGKARSRKLS